MASTPPDDLAPPADLPTPAPPPADPPADPPAAPPPAADPPNDDWRTRMAGEDDKSLGWLGRYPSEKAFFDDAKKRYDDFRGGKFIKPLSDDPSESEVKAWRDAMGVPEKPEGYNEKLTEGLVIGEDDRPVFDEFFSAMHAVGAPPSVVAKAANWYTELVQQQEAKISEATAAARVACEDTLREEFGADFRRNMNATDGYIETLPAELQDAINGGFDAKGIPLKSNAAFVKWMAGQALEANPLHTVVPGAGANQPQAIDDEIATIEKEMRENRSAYNKNEKMQERYRTLITARLKLKGDDGARAKEHG